ncbi:MAG: hypothetical protein BGO14_01330 [Chlamydiales bacterium 38-26]|nr:MAG: hypothetical protein BGO14_01330 [Chlamydiales bacterium 38-26]
MRKIFPNKLSPRDEIRIIYPARILVIVDLSTRKIAKERLEALDLKVFFSSIVKNEIYLIRLQFNFNLGCSMYMKLF